MLSGGAQVALTEVGRPTQNFISAVKYGKSNAIKANSTWCISQQSKHQWLLLAAAPRTQRGWQHLQQDGRGVSGLSCASPHCV